jgi:hypothetical protein
VIIPRVRPGAVATGVAPGSGVTCPGLAVGPGFGVAVTTTVIFVVPGVAGTEVAGAEVAVTTLAVGESVGVAEEELLLVPHPAAMSEQMRIARTEAYAEDRRPAVCIL